MLRALPAFFAAALLWPACASAQQDNSVEGRLREALRRTTVELRALQDGQAGLQAKLDQATQQRDQLQKQVDALNAKLAQPPPPDPELPKLREQIDALQQQNAALQAALQKVQRAYQDAAALARTKSAEANDLGQKLQLSEAKLKIATTANGKLISEANDILHLYRTQDFRSLLLGSYEPLLGFKRVELENMVQDYEDHILAQKYYGNAALPNAATPTQPSAKP